MATPATPQNNSQQQVPLVFNFTFTFLQPVVVSHHSPSAGQQQTNATAAAANVNNSTNDSNTTSQPQNTGPSPQQPQGGTFYIPASLLFSLPFLFGNGVPVGSQASGPAFNFADFLNHTFQMHQQQRAGPPPASTKAVESLDETSIEDDKHPSHGQDCAVCQDSFKVGDKVLKLPCEHCYHGDCVRPWLKEHNTCPVCRYELPTDDSAYEKERVERMKKRDEAINKRHRERERQCELGRIRRDDCCLFGEPSFVTLDCGHVLHKECAIEWDRAHRNGKCPVCNKQTQFPQPEEEQHQQTQTESSTDEEQSKPSSSSSSSSTTSSLLSEVPDKQQQQPQTLSPMMIQTPDRKRRKLEEEELNSTTTATPNTTTISETCSSSSWDSATPSKTLSTDNMATISPMDLQTDKPNKL